MLEVILNFLYIHSYKLGIFIVLITFILMEIYYSEKKKERKKLLKKEKEETKELLKYFKKEFITEGIKYRIFVVLSIVLCILIFSFLLIFIACILKDVFIDLYPEWKKANLDEKLFSLLFGLFAVRCTWMIIVFSTVLSETSE